MSSVRSEYTVAELRKQVTAKRDKRIRKAEETCAHESAISARRDEWRAKVEADVRSLHRRLKTVTDTELEHFRIKSAPSWSSYRTPEGARDREVSDANASYERAVLRLDAIKSDKGTLHLTPSMLNDLFGL